jgi:hypothetical protein
LIGKRRVPQYEYEEEEEKESYQKAGSLAKLIRQPSEYVYFKNLDEEEPIISKQQETPLYIKRFAKQN